MVPNQSKLDRKKVQITPLETRIVSKKTVFFNSVFEIFVLKVCVLKQFQKITVYVENVDFRKTHQACVYHEGNGYFGVFVHVWSDASLFNMAFQMLDYENSASDADHRKRRWPHADKKNW